MSNDKTNYSVNRAVFDAVGALRTTGVHRAVSRAVWRSVGAAVVDAVWRSVYAAVYTARREEIP